MSNPSFALPRPTKSRRLILPKDTRTITELANGLKAKDPSAPCHMMLLSKEVRQRIFQLLLARHDTPIPVAPFATYNPNITGHLRPEEDPRSGQLLKVCRTFYNEGAPVLYGLNAMLLRNATRVAQLSGERWWARHARWMLREVVISDCEKYFGVTKQAITLHGAQLRRVVLAPPLVVVAGRELWEISKEEVRDEALRVCQDAHLDASPSQDLGDVVVDLARLFPNVDVVLRIAARLEPMGRNISPPVYFEYSAADIGELDRRSEGEVSEED